jgi:glycosyltransferase involved in cell wall biosynthesis
MDFSIVIPVYNNSNTLIQLQQSLTERLKKQNYSFEIIYVEDFSSDNSFEILTALKKENDCIKIIQLAYNHTQQISFYIGMKHAIGNHIIFISADLQEEMDLVDKYIISAVHQPSVDLFVGLRTENKDYLIFRILSKLFYKIIRLKVKKIPENGFDTLCIKKQTLQKFMAIHRNNSFIQAELVKCADNIMPVPYVRQKSSNDKLNIRGFLSKIKYFVVSLIDVYFGNRDTSTIKYEIKNIL